MPAFGCKDGISKEMHVSSKGQELKGACVHMHVFPVHWVTILFSLDSLLSFQGVYLAVQTNLKKISWERIFFFSLWREKRKREYTFNLL